MATLYLHIGSNKAGSTSLQVFLAANRDRLAEQGIVYPIGGADAQGAHHPLCLTFLDLSQPINAAFRRLQLDPRIVDAVMREVEGADRVLISSEALFWVFGLDLEVVGRFLERFDQVIIICYLRRHDSYLDSMYKSRAVRGDALPSFEQFCEFMDRDYWLILEQWRQLPRVERLVVRPFVPAVWVKSHLCTDFLSCIDSGLVEHAYQPVSDENVSETLPVVDALIRLNHAGIDRGWDLLPLLRKVTADFPVPDRSGYLTEALQRAIQARYAATDRRVAAAYWSAAEADAYFSQPVPAARQPYLGLTDAQVIRVFAAVREWRDVGQ